MSSVTFGVDTIKFEGRSNFQRRPCVIKDCNLGDCVDKWTPEYLISSVSAEKEVKVHVTTEDRMSFIDKNFAYRTLPFVELIRRASSEEQHNYFFKESEKYYLRSLAEDVRKQPANFEREFPELAKDLRVPPLFDTETFFSSVLRVGSPGIHLWTHYDVMDNILIQVSGRKRVVLFAPKDALNLYMNGDKSEVLNIDDPDLKRFPLFTQAQRYECELQPGDVLFIPALWFHNVVSLDFSVAVNVFFRHLPPTSYDPRDVYGNKDPVVACRSLQGVDKACKTLEALPDEYRDFYLRRMISILQSKLT